jgi:energy-coupling factor transporter ATP-binding protein EcfA2
MDAVITTEDLRKSFRGRKGTVEAVQGVSFQVGRGEIFGFLGPNGAGKTTTLRMLTTLLPSTGAGRAWPAPTLRASRIWCVNGSATSAKRVAPTTCRPAGRTSSSRAAFMEATSTLCAIVRKSSPPCSTSPNSPIGRLRAIREASAAASMSLSGSFTNPRSCSSTSPPPASIPRTGKPVGPHPSHPRARVDGLIDHALSGRGGCPL